MQRGRTKPDKAAGESWLTGLTAPDDIPPFASGSTSANAIWRTPRRTLCSISIPSTYLRTLYGQCATTARCIWVDDASISANDAKLRNASATHAPATHAPALRNESAIYRQPESNSSSVSSLCQPRITTTQQSCIECCAKRTSSSGSSLFERCAADPKETTSK